MNWLAWIIVALVSASSIAGCCPKESAQENKAAFYSGYEAGMNRAVLILAIGGPPSDTTVHDMEAQFEAWKATGKLLP